MTKPSPTGTAQSFVDLLRWRTVDLPDQHAYTYHSDISHEPVTLTYAELDRCARSIGALLQQSMEPGSRVLLVYPPGLAYVCAFFGCLYAQMIAVPVYPPRRRQQTRLQAIVHDADVRVALTTEALLPTLIEPETSSVLANLRWIVTDSVLPEPEEWRVPVVPSTDLAFLQYTSGSTSTPKGVMVSHANLLANSAMIYERFGHSTQSRGTIWLPAYHDMGLIGGILQPLYGGFPVTLLSPLAFLQRPLRWLEMISQTLSTTSGGPNFAYELCVQRSTPAQRANLDLSNWKVAFTGAEPINPHTIRRFSEAFAPYGFDPAAFLPCYGLAEATLMVSGKHHDQLPTIHTFSTTALSQNYAQRAVGAEARALVACGPATEHQTIQIVDPTTRQCCPNDTIGEIWVKGANVALGYWGRPEQSLDTFQAYTADTNQGPFLRTGDLGFVHEGDLYVTGRIKDLIILRGRNYAPHDLEQSVAASHPSLRLDACAAFTVTLDDDERLVVMQELEYRQRPDRAEVAAAIRGAVSEDHDLAPAAIVLMRPGSLPKTSSGKIQRHACRELFLAGSADAVYRWSASQQAQEHDIAAPDVIALVAAILGCPVDALEPTQSLTRYGLDSLAAIEIIHAVELRYGATLPITQLLGGMSLEQLVAAVELNESAPPERNDSVEFPLTTGQHALWMLQQLAPTSAAYSIARAVRIQALDLDAFQAACERLIDRHPMLRATFHEQDDQVIQRIAPTAKVAFTIHQRAIPTEAELLAELEVRAWRPFDLQSGPLLRFDVYPNHDAWVVLVSMHHIIGDLWSLMVLLEHLIELYEAQRRGLALTFPPARGSYANLVEQQQEQLRGAEGAKDLAFWREHLAGELSVLNLLADRPRPPVQQYQGASLQFRIDASTTAQLQQLATQHQTTLYVVLLTAFQLLLHRQSGQPEIIVGAPVNGRQHAWLAEVVGYCVNVIPQRAIFGDQPTFLELLNRNRDAVLAMLEHAAYPFPLLVEALHPQRDASHSPIFQAMFTFQQPHKREIEIGALALGDMAATIQLGPLTIDVLPLPQTFAQVDLALMMIETQGMLIGSLQYATALFEEASIAVIASHFQTLLAGIVAAPATAIGLLPLASAHEMERLLPDVQPSGQSIATIPHHFAECVAVSPEAIAVRWREQALTYRELDRRATGLAHTLSIEPETLVGVCLERSPELIIALLAILKAGGAYVPLDPNYPASRLGMMLDDCAVTTILTTRQLAKRLPANPATLLFIDEEPEAAANLPLPTTNNPDQLAYVMYTSGSTGRPKGVAVTHRGIIRLVKAQNYAVFGPETTILHTAPIAFDAATLEIWGALLNGAQLVIAPAEPLTPAAMAELLRREQITTLWLTAGLFHQIVDERPDAFATLRQLLAGGDVLSVPHVRRVLEHLPAGVVINGYGPTENTTFTCCHTIRTSDLQRPSIPIGRPIMQTDVVILDRWLQPTPIGIAGELYTGGAGLARGYLGRPDLTAERFIPHPLSSQPGARLYRTGDQARFLPDGTIEFLGRSDQQIKLRGFRIELGEIESVLCQHPAIKTAGVIVREDRSGDKRIVAYLVAANEQPSTAELHDYLSQHLPSYMLPTAFVPLPALPLDANGKLHRQELPAPSREHFEVHGPIQAPQTPTEHAIAAIWAEILGSPTLSVHDNFFNLGGHSLLATQVISRLRETFHVEIPLSRLFQVPTIAGLAAAIEQEQADSRLAITPVISGTAQLLERIDELSEADIDQLLQAYLSTPDQEVNQ